jgi:hypothetical protein
MVIFIFYGWGYFFMKISKKFVVFGIAYFLLGFSGNARAEWYDEINGRKISDYESEIKNLEKSKNVNGLQVLLTIFKDDLAKADNIYRIAQKNIRGMEKLVERYAEGSANALETVLITHPIKGDTMDLSALDVNDVLRESREIKEKAWAKYSAIKKLIDETEAALKRLGVSAVPIVPMQPAASSSSSSSSSSFISPTPRMPIPTPAPAPAYISPIAFPTPEALRQRFQRFQPKEEPAVDVASLQKQLEKLQQEKNDWDDTFKIVSVEERKVMQPDVDKVNTQTQIKKLQEQISQAQEKKVEKKSVEEKKTEEPKQAVSDEEFARQIQIDEYVERLNSVKSLVDYNRILSDVSGDLKKEVQEKTRQNFEELKKRAHPSVLKKY